MYFDWTYIVFVLPAFLFALWAQHRVNATFARFQHQISRRGVTGAQAARHILDSNGLRHIAIDRIQGRLSDHYSPQDQVIRLSEGVYHSTSTAAIGVAAHEAGHALQYADNYAPIRVRNAILPVTNIGSKLAFPLFIVGLFGSGVSYYFIWVAYAGLAGFGLCVIFQLLTLPAEFNASKRALAAIEGYNFLNAEELDGARRVLSAAALTYVAALAVSLSYFLHYASLLNRRQ
ncbi:MAG: peptidase [Firmicutes bacterium]|nr:peptidase [Bacillota bacterium]